jgi:uncharacterized protein YecT (DUF1311 family)
MKQPQWSVEMSRVTGRIGEMRATQLHLSVKFVAVTMFAAMLWPFDALAATAEQFGVKVFPAPPTHGQNLEPELCSRVFDAVNAAYRGDEMMIHAPKSISTAFGRLKMSVIDSEATSTRDVLFSRVDLDLDGTGSLQTVALSAVAFNWRGHWHHGHVFPSPMAFDAIQAQWIEQSKKLQDEVPSPGIPVLGGVGFYPLANAADDLDVRTGSTSEAPVLFGFSERYYFVADNRPLPQGLPPWTIYRLRASGKVQPACVITQPPVNALYEELTEWPDVEAWLNVVRAIADPGPDRGTLHAESRHRAAARVAEQMAATRPWTMDGREAGESFEGEYYRYGPMLDEFLEQWSLQEPWTRREYQTLRSLMPSAIRSYSGYLQRKFGMAVAVADTAAFRVLNGVLAQHIIIPSGYQRYGIRSEHLQGLNTHAITSRERAEFEQLLAQIRGGEQEREIYSKLLPIAVEWPHAFDRLLELGADPNLGNHFGKTPLMVAAHLNRPDAVRKLLRAGAQVNSRSRPFKDYWTSIDRSSRTALMYAAENAGPQVIQLLLGAGADASLRDSQNNGTEYYLARNPRFAHEIRPREIREIATQSASAGQAGFDCNHAKLDVELAICTSEVLRMLDHEIASAFARLKPRRGPELIAEQRAWLATRNSACAVPDADCLAEVMRTRARALLLRAGECDGQSCLAKVRR